MAPAPKSPTSVRDSSVIRRYSLELKNSRCRCFVDRVAVLDARNDEVRRRARLQRHGVVAPGLRHVIQHRLELRTPGGELLRILAIGNADLRQMQHLLEHVRVVAPRRLAHRVLEIHVLASQRLECAILHRHRRIAHDQRGALKRSTQQDLVELDIVLDVRLALALLHLVERRLRDVDVPALDQVRNLPVEEREQQRADVRTVHVRVGVVAAEATHPRDEILVGLDREVVDVAVARRDFLDRHDRQGHQVAIERVEPAIDRAVDTFHVLADTRPPGDRTRCRRAGAGPRPR